MYVFARIPDSMRERHTWNFVGVCVSRACSPVNEKGCRAPPGSEARGWSHYRHKATTRLPSGLGLPLSFSFSLSPSCTPLSLPPLRPLRSYSWFKSNCLLSAIPESLMMESPRSEAPTASLSLYLSFVYSHVFFPRFCKCLAKDYSHWTSISPSSRAR